MRAPSRQACDPDYVRRPRRRGHRSAAARLSRPPRHPPVALGAAITDLVKSNAAALCGGNSNSPSSSARRSARREQRSADASANFRRSRSTTAFRDVDDDDDASSTAHSAWRIRRSARHHTGVSRDFARRRPSRTYWWAGDYAASSLSTRGIRIPAPSAVAAGATCCAAHRGGLACSAAYFAATAQHPL